MCVKASRRKLDGLFIMFDTGSEFGRTATNLKNESGKKIPGIKSSASKRKGRKSMKIRTFLEFPLISESIVGLHFGLFI